MPVLGLFVALGLVAAAAAPQIPPHPAILSHPEGLRFPPSSFVPPDPAVMRFELANGLPVYVVPDRSLPLVDVVLALPVGDLDEQPEEAGLASMTAAMLLRGGAGELDAGPSGRRDRRPGRPDSDGGRFGAERDRSRLRLGGRWIADSNCLLPSCSSRVSTRSVWPRRRPTSTSASPPRTTTRYGLLEREWLQLVHGGSTPPADGG